jgi:hypothetical protein
MLGEHVAHVEEQRRFLCPGIVDEGRIETAAEQRRINAALPSLLTPPSSVLDRLPSTDAEKFSKSGLRVTTRIMPPSAPSP